jgi:hypothetical protein
MLGATRFAEHGRWDSVQPVGLAGRLVLGDLRSLRTAVAASEDDS